MVSSEQNAKSSPPPPPQQNTNGSVDRHLLQRMARFRKNPFNFAYEILQFVRGTGWRGYRDVIGQPCFYPGYTENIKNGVMQSPVLRKKINDLTEARLKVEEKELLLDPESQTFIQDRERRKDEIISSLADLLNNMLDQMMCKMEQKAKIRAGFYVVTQCLTRTYSGIYVSEQEVARLREVAKIAASKKQSIIFLPRHTSHIDYITVHLVCYRLGLTVPVVVSGDNLNFPLVGSFLQSVGAMYIRRTFANDQLYTSAVQAYLDTMLQQGYNLECFIEGGRSRTGKLLQPKFGILSFFLDSVLSGRTNDVYICPVSLQYDKVIEVDSYVNELLGTPKQKESLVDFLSASSSILSLNMGRVDCRFHEPWSLREFIQEQQARLDHPGLQDEAAAAKAAADRIHLLRTLGYKVLSDINAVSVIMPTALVGTVLLTLRGRGVGKSELVRRVDWLTERVKANGGKLADFQGMPTSDIVQRALDVLGPKLVGTVDQLAEETYYAVDRFQLSFYRNMTIHLFISESLIAAALYTEVKRGGGSASERISESQLTDQVAFLSQLFRGEFIFPAGQGLEHNFQDAMQTLVRDQVLEITPGESRLVGLTAVERENGRENFDFYCFLIWPFCDAAWLGAISLLCLVPPPESSTAWIDMKKAQDAAQLFGRTLYHQGDLSYFEAINKEALKNAYTRFQEEGIVIVSRNPEAKGGPVVRLSPEWTPERDEETGEVRPAGKLWDLTERISQHRREGKNRRDEATVSTRVLRLAATLNEELFKDANDGLDEASRPTVPRIQRRTKL